MKFNAILFTCVLNSNTHTFGKLDVESLSIQWDDLYTPSLNRVTHILTGLHLSEIDEFHSLVTGFVMRAQLNAKTVYLLKLPKDYSLDTKGLCTYLSTFNKEKLVQFLKESQM